MNCSLPTIAVEEGTNCMLIFTEDEIRDCVQLDKAVFTSIEKAFTSLAANKVEMPPTLRINIPKNDGEVVLKTAYIPDDPLFAIKVSSGFFRNYMVGLPSMGGLMLLMNAQNGRPEAILYDNGYLTDVRTAVTGAIAANYLANETIDAVGVIGTGSQARLQLKALNVVRNFKRVYAYGRSQKNMFEMKKEIENALQVEVFLAEDAQEVVENSELLITATPSQEAIVKKEWVKRGTHITAVGADAVYKQELDPQLFQKATSIVCDEIEQCRDHGELRIVYEQNVAIDEGKICTLGELILSKGKGRTDENDVTIADLTGTGAQDTQIALFAYKKLTEEK